MKTHWFPLIRPAKKGQACHGFKGEENSEMWRAVSSLARPALGRWTPGFSEVCQRGFSGGNRKGKPDPLRGILQKNLTPNGGLVREIPGYFRKIQVGEILSFAQIYLISKTVSKDGDLRSHLPPCFCGHRPTQQGFCGKSSFP